MLITIRLFAVLRERAGVSERALDVAEGSTVAEAAVRVGREFPGVASMLGRVAYAVNQAYVPVTTQLHEGDELAIIPPVSGG
jgi:molybdopterin converting factor subunit 1